MGKVLVSINTEDSAPADYVVIDGENYPLLKLGDYGLAEQAARHKLDVATTELFNNPDDKTRREARTRLDNLVKLIVPTLPAEMVEALKDNAKIALANAYKGLWDVFSETAYKVHEENEDGSLTVLDLGHQD